MNKRVLISVLFIVPLTIVDANAELCPSSGLDVPESTPTSQFEYDQDSIVVIDKKTGLEWARCPWGYRWNSSTCVLDSDDVSDEQINWKQALLIVKDDPVYLGKQGWRLPNIKELASLVEYKCYDPAINTEVFPGTASGVFWSNTPVMGEVGAGKSNTIYVINFSIGQFGSVAGYDSSHYLRLVRDAD